MKGMFFGILALLLLSAACGGGSNGANAREIFIPVRRAEISELADTLTQAIRWRQHKTVMALYTEASAAAVQRSITTGLGTAGSIDDTILLEFENDTHDNKDEERAVEVIARYGERLELLLPSGKRINAVVTQENGGWAIDVIASTGGEILLLTD